MRRTIYLFLVAILFGSMWSEVKATQSLPYSYGFENNNLTADGWAKACFTSYINNNGECGIASVAMKTGSYGFRFSSYSEAGKNAQYLLSPEFSTPDGLVVSFAYKSSSTSYTEKFKVGYSTTGTNVADFTFGTEISTRAGSWQTYENTFPAGTKYITIYYYSNHQDRLYVDDFTFAAPGPRTVNISDNEDNASLLAGLLSSGETVNMQITRSLQMDGDYNPLCLPFNLSAEQLADEDCPLYNFKFKVFDHTGIENGETVIYVAEASNIEAGVPYFASYQGTPTDATSELLFRDVTITASEAGTKTCDNVTYHGNFSPSALSATTEVNPASLFIGDNNTIYYPNTDVNIKAFRAYFTIDYSNDSAPVRRVRFANEQENTATNLDTISSRTTKTLKMIRDGQLIIIRHGVNYSVLGQKMQ